jgi:hypothetical protein
MVIVKLRYEQNFWVADTNGHPFGDGDRLFGTVTPKKDNRMRNLVIFGDEKAVFARELHRSYVKLVEEGRAQFGKSGDWKIERIHAEEDRIIVECAEGADSSWFSEKMCPPLRLSEDGIYQAATRVPPGMWGKAAPPSPVGMLTRARAAAKNDERQVILATPSGETFTLGRAEFGQALELA